MLLKLTVLILLLTACTKQAHVKSNTMTVVAEAPEYQIGQISDTKFVIHASSVTAATKAAQDRLGCKKHPCFIQPDGVVIVVERPDAPKR